MTVARSYLYVADRERNKVVVKTWYHKFNNLGKKSIQLQQGNPSLFRIQRVRQINWNVSYTYRFLIGWIKASEWDSYCLNFWGEDLTLFTLFTVRLRSSSLLISPQRFGRCARLPFFGCLSIRVTFKEFWAENFIQSTVGLGRLFAFRWSMPSLTS